MSHVLDRVPVEQISAQAKDAKPGIAILTVIAAVFFGIGWTAGKAAIVVQTLFRGVWRGIVWSGVAVKVGWQTARAERSGEPAR